MKGVILDRASFDVGDLELGELLDQCPEWNEYEATTPSETAARIRDAQVAVSNKVVLDRLLLKDALELKLILVAATGTNNIDLEFCSERGITVCNVRDYATPAVVQHVFALMLALTTRLLEYNGDVRSGAWQCSESFCLLDYPIRELAGRTLGIVSYGVLGQGVATVAEAFGMHILLAQRPGGPAQSGRIPLPDMLPAVDVLTLHCPLTTHTEELIGAPEFALMRDDALLINTARGAIVDNAALAVALREGIIGGAGIDVLEREPPPNSHPLLAPNIPNLIVTPHTAWASRESRQRLVDQMAENLIAWLRGAPQNVVS